MEFKYWGGGGDVSSTSPPGIAALITPCYNLVTYKIVTWSNKDAAKVLYDVTKVLQECNAVTWFNKDVIKSATGMYHRMIRLQQMCCKSVT